MKIFKIKNILGIYFFTYILFANSQSAVADGRWHHVETALPHGEVYRVDPTTLKKIGKFRRIWYSLDWPMPMGEEQESSKIFLMEYDCNEDKERVLHVSGYNGPTGTGRKIFSLDETSEWRRVPPSEAGRGVMKYTCQSRTR